MDLASSASIADMFDRVGKVDAVVACTGILESFVMATAAELPRGLRINAVSPSVLEEATGYHSYFPGFARIPAEEVGQAYVKSVDGIQTGRVFSLGQAHRGSSQLTVPARKQPRRRPVAT
ncbi:hypothetical protein [Arthrobacter sp. TE12232]